MRLSNEVTGILSNDNKSMWSVKVDTENQDRGGFQDRDVGRRSFDNDYGPEYGVDYARFSDIPNLNQDNNLKTILLETLTYLFNDEIIHLELKVKNAFVIVQGSVPSLEIKSAVLKVLSSVKDVTEVINDLKVSVTKPKRYYRPLRREQDLF